MTAPFAQSPQGAPAEPAGLVHPPAWSIGQEAPGSQAAATVQPPGPSLPSRLPQAPQPRAPQPARARSAFGLVSLFCGIGAFVLIAVWFVVEAIALLPLFTEAGAPLSAAVSPQFWWLGALAGLAGFAGLGFGIAALVQRGRTRAAAIVGLILSVLALINWPTVPVLLGSVPALSVIVMLFSWMLSAS